MYDELKTEALEEILKAKKEKIKAKLKERLEKRDRIQEALRVVEKEVDLLVQQGQLTNLEDYIKIEADGDATINITTERKINQAVSLQVGSIEHL